MSLEGLLNDAFARGCGISRQAALKTPRYRELLTHASRVPHTTQAETAEMMYLGERLADRAFRNLPHSFRERARMWPNLSDDEKHATLKGLIIKLKSQEWQLIHRRSGRPENTVSDVLPAEYGSWTRGKTQPNCLGVSQMLIGFARAAGAEHLMVDTVTQFDYHHEQIYEQICREMIEQLAPYKEEPSIARLIRKLTKYHEQSLVALAHAESVRQAHHALLIKVGDDWVVVDPYMSTKYTLRTLRKARSDPHAAIMKEPRRRWMCFGGEMLRIDCVITLRALKDVLEYYERRNEPARTMSMLSPLKSAALTLCWRGILLRNNRSIRLNKEKLPDGRVEQTLRHLVAICITTQRSSRSSEQDSHDAIANRLQGMSRRKRERNAALVRLIKHLCLIAITTPYDATETKSAEHRRIELCHPTLHLAVMTLNHIGVMTDRPAAQLIRFDTSQWLLHDTLKEVTTSDDPRLHRIADRALRRIGKLSHHAMPQLLTESNKRK